MERIVSCYSVFNTGNLYSDNIKRLLKEQNIESMPIKKCLTDLKLFKECAIYNLNWYENINSDNDVKNFFIYHSKVLILKWLKLNKKKIIYTIHNKKPHNLKSDKYSIKMMNKLCEYSDVIVGLCPDTKEVIKGLGEKYLEKFQVVYHPNYISNYENEIKENYREKLGIQNNDLVFLILGYISPYKNIEILIDIFSKVKENNIKLLIAGKPCSDEYKKELVKKIDNNKNIITDFRYIPDEEMSSYYNTSDIVILPYNQESSLNSGAVYLSFSLKRTVICPEIGTITALMDDSFVYSYNYKDEKEHKNNLELIISKVQNDFKENQSIIREKGVQAYNYVDKYHSDSEISEKYGAIYSSLINDTKEIK
ncbi:glycosyltransferase family 4 protein [Clostridium sp. AL.422]|uniref:glycosyltransferase family 4 protein n=1 Tax=Clostridium TaxID=1485 RepID=UPI00293DC648|nr:MULTISPECIES: glycosyltransferase family 4 protein [unclassified Clostridium]MDV4150303.1 glycosyltransferase family 4 protein [Clostridium sp. AL.422]